MKQRQRQRDCDSEKRDRHREQVPTSVLLKWWEKRSFYLTIVDEQHDHGLWLGHASVSTDRQHRQCDEHNHCQLRHSLQDEKKKERGKKDCNNFSRCARCRDWRLPVRVRLSVTDWKLCRFDGVLVFRLKLTKKRDGRRSIKNQVGKS